MKNESIRSANQLTEKQEASIIDILSIDTYRDDNAFVSCKVAGFTIVMLIDSGASINAISEEVFAEMSKSQECIKRLRRLKYGSDRTLLAYASKSRLNVLATFDAPLWIDHIRPHTYEEFFVIKGAKRSLMGKNTALRFNLLQIGLSVPVNEKRLDTENVNSVSNAITEKFPHFKLEPVKLNIDESVQPRRSTYDSIPPGWRQSATDRLNEMLNMGIIEKVIPGMDTRYCSSLLAVAKGKDDFRLVVDLRGPNKCIIREPHKMPTLDTILVKLDGSKVFSTIDLSNAFFHVILDESSRHITNFYSGGEFFRYIRLPFGLSNAPDIFQEALEKILKDCTGVVIYLDDILVFGKTRQEHDENLRRVLERL